MEPESSLTGGALRDVDLRKVSARPNRLVEREEATNQLRLLDAPAQVSPWCIDGRMISVKRIQIRWKQSQSKLWMTFPMTLWSFSRQVQQRRHVRNEVDRAREPSLVYLFIYFYENHCWESLFHVILNVKQLRRSYGNRCRAYNCD